MSTNEFLRVHPHDNVEVDLSTGMKRAATDIKRGEKVIKYGYPIGIATRDIKCGERVHTENLRSAIEGVGEWEFHPADDVIGKSSAGATFMGYLREDGRVGIRNDIFIIPTVGCANCTAKVLSEKTGAKALTHQFGCSQLGGDLEMTRKILCGLARNPNAGGVLILGLGCEENTLDSMREELGESPRIKYLNTQDVSDEIEEGIRLISELKEVMSCDRRTELPIGRLTIGVKCGGSDGYSGLTANPLVGRSMEFFVANGATLLMTEIPEAFGAEEILLSHCADVTAFNEVSEMLHNFRGYFIKNGEGISDNPSPGNIAGGITTLEEKSLGCVQKGGRVRVLGGLYAGETPTDRKPSCDVADGLFMVNGPGNDLIAVTNLAASGAAMILFTTGRGTPLCAPVPTLKLSTNSRLYEKKPHWIDFDAGRLICGDAEELRDELCRLCIDTAEGKLTVGEARGYYDIAIWKNGVTL